MPTRILQAAGLVLFFAAPALAQPPANAEAILAKAKQVLARIDGDVMLPGLREPVEVLRDRWGIAHIYAKNTHDLFFAQGFVAAQDRLFQIDLWRRQGAGEMAEVFGPGYVAADLFARLMKYRGDMDAEWKSYAPDTKEIATAFTEGINACIDQFGDHPPIEFQLLGYRPKKWKPEDVLGRMSGIYMSQNFRNEISRARLIAAVGIAKARWLAPVDPPRDYSSLLSADDLKAIDQRILADYDAATKALSFKPSKTQSNNWVVAGSRSQSGKPLLASDPHRAIALPSLRYLVHLNAPGWNVIGSGEPGLPGVAIGHNDRIAWGITIIGVDQVDFYVEETNPQQIDEYKAKGRWERMTTIHDTIAVKGEGLRPVTLHYTRHGPVLFHDKGRNRAYALKWVGSEPGGAAYLASLRVDRARNDKEFIDALKAWKIPGLNFVYADVEGTIGWIAAAHTPVRPKHDGLLPVPGDGGFEWDGYLSVDQLPQSFNPKSGWLATANHNIIPEGYPHQIGYEFAPPYRFERVKTRLTSRDKWSVEDMRAIQQDNVSLPGLALAKLLKNVTFADKEVESYRKLLMEWDGKLTVDSKAGPLYAIWLRMLQEKVYGDLVPKSLQSGAASLSGLPTMLEALAAVDQRWFPATTRESLAADLLKPTFESAVRKLKALPESQRQRWGALHTVTFRHPLAADPVLAKAFNLGPLERPGDGNTPNNARYDDNYKQIHGPTYRHLLDLADWDKALATSAPGQSGQLGSPHYSDLLSNWDKGEYFPMVYSRKKVDESMQNRLRLVPK